MKDKYTPSREYGPGFIPEDKLNEEDGEIEIPPEYAGKAGTGSRPEAERPFATLQVRRG